MTMLNFKSPILLFINVSLTTGMLHAGIQTRSNVHAPIGTSYLSLAVPGAKPGGHCFANCGISFSAGGTGSVTIMNNSGVGANNVTPKIPAGSGITVQSNPCYPIIAPHTSCTITFTATSAEGPTNIPIWGDNTNNGLSVDITVTASATTFSVAPATLVVATQGIFTAASGAGIAVSKARSLTITNTGASTANNVTYSISPALPTGTTITPASCSSIAAGGTCILTITPGTTPSGAANAAPTISVLTITGTATTAGIIVLTYGNRFQNGFVFAIDDSTAITGSVGGKVASLADEAAPGTTYWSTDAGGLPVADDIVAAEDNNNGAANTTAIVAFYPGVNPAFYAAGICNNIAWYLPAACEMGYGVPFPICGTAAAPSLQNMMSNLVDNGGIGGLSASPYWSSTQTSLTGGTQAIYLDFTPASTLARTFKMTQYAVRCVRAIT